MAQNKKNLAQIIESWTPAIKQLTKNAVNESNPDKLAWMCEYAHNHTMKLNEEAVGGVSFPYQTLNNTLGIGNAVPASSAGQTAADQMSPASIGSGDKWPALLPMALQVAARTIGFDLVNTIPFQGPTGVLPFLDYVYAGSKDVYGATPAYDEASANPEFGPNKVKAPEMYDAPHAFRCKVAPKDGVSFGKQDDYQIVKADCIKALKDAKDGITELGTTTKIKVQFIGLSRLSGEPMFKVMPGQTSTPLSKIFGADNKVDVAVDNVVAVLL